MKIGVALNWVAPENGGVTNYALSLLRHWPEFAPDHPIVLFSFGYNEPLLETLPPETRGHEIRLQTPEGAMDHLDKIDVYFSPIGRLWPRPVRKPSVVTFHDMQERFFPQFFTPEQCEERFFHYDWSLRMADAVIAISEFTRDTMIKIVDLSPAKIHVVPHVPDALPQAHKPAGMDKLAAGRPFMFYPANFWEHKNHLRLLAAMGKVETQVGELALVCTGSLLGREADWERAVRAAGVKGSVIHLGQVTRAEISWLYRHCRGLIFPSLFEGFGIPLLEAMQTERPIACGCNTSQPEVARSAALYFDAERPESIASAIVRLHRDSALRERLVEAGRERVRAFTAKRQIEGHLAAFAAAQRNYTAFRAWVNERVRLPRSMCMRSKLTEREARMAARLLREYAHRAEAYEIIPAIDDDVQESVPPKMRIGILDQPCTRVSNTSSYSRMLLASLATANSAHLPNHGSPSAETTVFLDRGSNVEVPEQFEKVSFDALAHRRASSAKLDVVLPVGDKAVHEIQTTKVGWLLDFTHYRLPSLFKLDDLAARDALYETIARKCELVIVPSETSRKDFEKFLPLFASKVRVLSFPSTLWEYPLTEDPRGVVSHYHLPLKFVLVASRFCSQSNHAVLPTALSILKSQGISVPLVLTDSPNPNQAFEDHSLSELFQACARLGISDQIHFLGHVPYSELISLMRCAALIIESSLSEGWNTNVADAKALGRPLICSDILVHREQAPQAVGFFPTDSPEDLASLLATHYPQLHAGPAFAAERDALMRSKSQAAEFRQALLSIAREAVRIAHPDKVVAPNGAVEMRSTPISRHRKTSWIRNYLTQKRSHLKYVIGKLTFHITYWRRNIDQLRHLLYRFSLSFHGQELGILRQYPARSLQLERFPAGKRGERNLPIVSIVTPTFNQGQTLRATIESVIQQKYPQAQYAVIDGGSADETKKILARHKSDLSYCVSEPDDGQAHAIAKGFAALRGDIMAYLNSDDMLMPGALSFVGRYFATHPRIDVIYGHRVIVDECGREVGRWILPRHDKRAIRHFDYVPQETLFWRRPLYEKVGGINPAFHFAMDWDLLLRFMAAGAQIRRVPYFLACFRIHTRQKTHTLLDTVGEREKLHLLVREHPDGFDAESVQQLQDRYRFRSSLCALLLKFGVRY
jgi:glycosyltransferase involved in cell wall biosynthesis